MRAIRFVLGSLSLLFGASAAVGSVILATESGLAAGIVGFTAAVYLALGFSLLASTRKLELATLNKESMSPNEVRRGLVNLRNRRRRYLTLLVFDCLAFISALIVVGMLEAIAISGRAIEPAVGCLNLLMLGNLGLHLMLIVIAAESMRQIGYARPSRIVVVILLLVPIPIIPLAAMIWVAVDVTRFLNTIEGSIPFDESQS